MVKKSTDATECAACGLKVELEVECGANNNSRTTAFMHLCGNDRVAVYDCLHAIYLWLPGCIKQYVHVVSIPRSIQ